MSGISHALSEKAIKKLGLDKKEKLDLTKSREVVKEWNNPREYWADQECKWKEEDKKLKKKIKNFFKYRIAWRLRDWWWNTKWYFHNLKTFKPILKEWRSFDYHYQIDLFKFGIDQLAKAMEYYGNEVPESRLKRIEAMQTLIKEIDRDYEEDVRQRLNYEYMDSGKVSLYADGSVCFHGDDSEEHQKKTDEYYAEVKKERKAHYQKIFDLIIGQDNDDVQKEIERRMNEIPEEEKKSMSESELYTKIYNEVWDGSGIEGWWD